MNIGQAFEAKIWRCSINVVNFTVVDSVNLC